MTDGADVNNYSYDPLDRLTAATHPNQTNETYTYDDLGNRTASHQGSSYTTTVFNRLTAANGATFGRIEVPSLVVEGIIKGSLRREVNESAGDLAADAFGQAGGYIIWKSCVEVCKQCPF
jgi:YD repeat-containing protein